MREGLKRLSAFVRLGRPRFLMGGVVLYAGGSLLAASLDSMNWRAWFAGQCAITATQLMTHYANDYFDVEADRFNALSTRWSGGSRVLVDGPLSPRVARDAAIVLLLLALAIDSGILLGVLGASGGRSMSAGAMLLLALALSWSYSGPPLRLHARGFGALAAAIVVGGLTPLIGFAMQGGDVTTSHAIRWGVRPHTPIACVAPLVVAQSALILILDLPDAPSDAEGGKRTLAVRLGERTTSRVALGLIALTYAAALVLVSVNAVRWAMLATMPIGLLAAHALHRERWNAPAGSSTLTSRAVVWFAALSSALLVGAASRGVMGGEDKLFFAGLL